MIEWFRQLRHASRNLARTVRQNPVWAVQGLVFAPFRFARHLFGVLVLTIAVATVLILVSDGLVWYFRLDRFPALHTGILLLVWLAILLVPLRALFQGSVPAEGEMTLSHDCHPRRRPSLLLRWPRDQRSH